MKVKIQNVVIGKPIVELFHLLGEEQNDRSYEEHTKYTSERYLPRILVELGMVPSTSWVRKNKPEFNVKLNELDFLQVRISKKKDPIWIVVGK